MVSSWIHEKKSYFVDEEETVIASQLKLILNILVPQIFPQHSVHVLRLKLFFLIIRNNECNCNIFIQCNCTSFSSTFELQTSKTIKKNTGKNTMKGTEEESFLPFAFCLVILSDNGLQALFCLLPYKRGMCIDGIIIGAQKLVVAVSVFEGLGPTGTPVLSTHFFLPTSESHHKVSGSGQHLNPPLAEQGASWAKLFCRRCFWQARWRPPHYSGVQEGTWLTAILSEAQGVCLNCSFTAVQDWSQCKIFMEMLTHRTPQSIYVFGSWWVSGSRYLK